MKMYKILIAGRTPYHFVYYKSIIQSLIEMECEIFYVTDKKWSEGQSHLALDEFKAKYETQISHHTYEKNINFRQKLVYLIRNIMTCASYLERSNQSSFYYKRWRNYLPRIWQRLISIKFIKRIIRYLYKLKIFQLVHNYCVDTTIECEIIKKNKIDYVLVCPGNMRFGNEIDFVKAAKKLGIHSSLSVYSWDNLSTKGLIHFQPDEVFCWNETHKNEAINIHKINAKRISVVGAPFFDRFHASSGNEISQSPFQNQNPYILYVGSSANIAKNESEITKQVIGCAREYKFNTLVRPHPANTKPFDKITDTEDVIVQPRNGKLPEDSLGQKEIVNVLNGAQLVIGLNTSAFLDSILCDRPTAIIKSKKYIKTQDLAVHFRVINESNSCYILENEKEIHGILNDISHNKDTKSGLRKKFVKQHLFPSGEVCTAGNQIAHKVITKLRKK